MNADKKQIESTQAVQVNIMIKSGNYEKHELNGKTASHVAADLHEFMSVSNYQIVKFYVFVKSYLQERKGIERYLNGDTLIEKIINACMTNVATDMAHKTFSKLLNKHSIKFKVSKRYNKMMKELAFAKSTELTQKAFDDFCHSKYGVVGEVASEDHPQVDMHMKGQS
tara:strand:- start:472 stop:975 length:504 start_codon:yes stop_codon:yes gene_type:complete